MDLQLREILGEVSADKESAIQELLYEIGVKCNEDLAFVREEDLLKVVPAIPARKLVKSWSVKSGAISSTTSDSDSTSGSTSASWLIGFEIPWDQLPSDLMQCCENGSIPHACERRQMIRILADAVLHKCKKPRIQEIESICCKIVEKYPKSFRDEADGVTVGSGYSSMVKQLQFRIENVKRKPRKIKLPINEIPVNVKRDEYGCVDWAPECKDLEDQEKERMWLVEEWKKVKPNHCLVEEKMKYTYPYQRQQINGNLSILNLKQKWPFLFDDTHLFGHYAKLIGKEHLKRQLISEMDARCGAVFE